MLNRNLPVVKKPVTASWADWRTMLMGRDCDKDNQTWTTQPWNESTDLSLEASPSSWPYTEQRHSKAAERLCTVVVSPKHSGSGSLSPFALVWPRIPIVLRKDVQDRASHIHYKPLLVKIKQILTFFPGLRQVKITLVGTGLERSKEYFSILFSKGIKLLLICKTSVICTLYYFFKTHQLFSHFFRVAPLSHLAWVCVTIKSNWDCKLFVMRGSLRTS